MIRALRGLFVMGVFDQELPDAEHPPSRDGGQADQVHEELRPAAEDGDPIRVACDCEIGHDHSYAERLALAVKRGLESLP